MGFWKRTINHAYRLDSNERKLIEDAEHQAYIKESIKLAAQRGFEKARQDYE